MKPTTRIRKPSQKGGNSHSPFPEHPGETHKKIAGTRKQQTPRKGDLGIDQKVESGAPTPKFVRSEAPTSNLGPRAEQGELRDK